MDWKSTYKQQDINLKYKIYHSTLKHIIEQVVPLKEVKVKQDKKPRVNSKIIEEIKDRERFTGEQEGWVCKTNFCKLEANSCRNDQKRMWKTISALLQKKTKQYHQ